VDITITTVLYLSTRVLNSHDSLLLQYNMMLGSRYQKLYQSGFTMIEAVTVIAIMGVLSVVLIPTADNVSGSAFYVRGFHDESLALLRYGQKAAIAKRRTVCVTFTRTDNEAHNVALSIATTATTQTCDTNLQGPKGGDPKVTAMSGVAYSATPTVLDFYYDGLGTPFDASGDALVGPRTIQVVGAAKTITVEAYTGYTHDYNHD
jgi:MSHA pilin protein MshC